MLEQIIAAVVCGVLGGVVGVAVAWGAASARLKRVEDDVAKCVTREVYAANQTALDAKLTRIETMVERLFDRLTGYARTPRPGDTDPGIPR